MIIKINQNLEPYKHIITIALIIVLAALALLTYKSTVQQEEIVNTCGYTSGEIRCVCTEQAWNEYEKSKLLEEEIKINLEG